MSLHKYSLEDRGMTAIEKNIFAGEIFEMHWHDYIELEIIFSGNAEHIYNSEAYELKAGHAYIVTHHDLHAFRAVNNIRLVNICFDINFIDNELTHSLLYYGDKNLRCAFDDKKTKQIYDMCNKLIFEQNIENPFSITMRKAILSQLVIEIIRCSPLVIHSPTLSQKALEYIHLNFKEQLSLGILADYLSVTPNYLGRIFTRDTGMSFNAYLNKIRLRYICNMLLYSSLTVKEISAMSGYSSLEYFFYIFKKHFGISPVEYRKINTSKLTLESISTNSILI